ncbi:MAG: serine/threonine-protein kinase, partial [Pirellulaceae bacterium]|nr:serine/threonine-protein kinase [Pirellulaceae bacterium]
PYLVMPYIRGASLQRRLDESGPLAVDEVLRIAHQTARGLAAAHAQGLVHRDIKPANILLADGVERVRITDFGLARAGDDASITNSGVIAGTPQYMSPEQARGDTIDQRSDLFSLGSVVYAMCTGLPPFTASTGYGVLRKITDSEPRPVIEVNSSMPPWLDKIVLRLLAKTPDDRFQSASEVGDLLEQCLAHVQQPTKHPLPSYCRTSQPGASLTRLGALGATAVAVTLAAFWYSRGGDESTEQQPAATQSGQSEPFSFPPETAWLDQAEELQDIDVETRELDARSQRDFDYSVTPPSVNP